MNESELIGNPVHWRLVLGVGRDALEIVAMCPGEDNSLIHRRVELAAGDGVSRLKRLEDAVYDCPLLLLDYGRVSCVLDAELCVVAPVEAGADPDVARRLLELSGPGFGGEVFVGPTSMDDASILWGYDAEVTGFLRRTFYNARLMCRLEPLCSYFGGISRRVNVPRMFVNVSRGAVDVVAVDRGRLLVANTFRRRTPEDAAYYVMAARESEALRECELLVSGQSGEREEMMGLLRRFVPGTMPVIFPSEMFRLGREAMMCPFELIVEPYV